MKSVWIALLLACGPSSASEPEAVDAFLARFYADFGGKNIERLSSEYFYPGAHAVFGEHVAALSTPDDVRRMFSAILASLEKRGYHRSSVRNVTTQRVSDSYVLATVLIDRLAVDGNRIDTVCSSYALLKTATGWRFLTWIPTDPLPDGRCA